MAAEVRQELHAAFVVDVECGLEEDWGDDAVGAYNRVDEHNEQTHPHLAAGAIDV